MPVSFLLPQPLIMHSNTWDESDRSRDEDSAAVRAGETAPQSVERDPEWLRTSPHFLEILDEDPDTAWAEFYQFAFTWLREFPPPILRRIPVEEREELISSVVQSCQENGFRKLRQYVDRGKPFLNWFYTVVKNRVLDHLRSPLRREQGLTASMPAEGPDPSERLAAREQLDAVERCLGKVSPTCRLLLLTAAEGYKPRELVYILGKPGETNKQMGDRLSECRKALRKCVKKMMGEQS